MKRLLPAGAHLDNHDGRQTTAWSVMLRFSSNTKYDSGSGCAESFYAPVTEGSKYPRKRGLEPRH